MFTVPRVKTEWTAKIISCGLRCSSRRLEKSYKSVNRDLSTVKQIGLVIYFFFILFFLQLYLQHMKVPRLGVEWEL